MPTCTQCSKPFPTWVTIEGKPRNLCNRQRCLECSPWGQHNTRKVRESDPTTLKQRVRQWSDAPCERCGSPRGRSGGKHCSSCSVTLWRKRMKLRAVAYKGGKCVECGFDTYVTALEFHHLDPSEKEFTFAGVTIGWDRMKTELDKCVLLCSNCHRAVHGGELTLNSSSPGVGHA